MTKEEFVDWKANPVTKAVFGLLESRLREIAVDLSFSAGVNQSDDRFKAGICAGLRELLTIDFTEGEEEESE